MPLNIPFQKNKKIFLITGIEVSLILMLAAVALRPFSGEVIFYLTEIILSFIFLKILLIDIKKETKKEHKYSVYFFVPLFLLVQLSWAAQLYFKGLNNLSYFFGFIFVIFLYIAFFRLVIGRNYTFGKVILSNEKIAVVQTDYDIRSFSIDGKHVIEINKKLVEGQNIKISFKTTIFGKKTAKLV